MDTGDVCVRMCLIGVRGDFSRSVGDCGSGEVELCLEFMGGVMGDVGSRLGGDRSGIVGRA